MDALIQQARRTPSDFALICIILVNVCFPTLLPPFPLSYCFLLLCHFSYLSQPLQSYLSHSLPVSHLRLFSLSICPLRPSQDTPSLSLSHPSLSITLSLSLSLSMYITLTVSFPSSLFFSLSTCTHSLSINYNTSFHSTFLLSFFGHPTLLYPVLTIRVRPIWPSKTYIASN